MQTQTKVHVGFKWTSNPDTNKYDAKLGYVIRNKTPGWEKWRNKDISPVELENIPRSGFKLVGVTKRSSEWFGSGRNMFRIQHPEGFQFEITANNLLAILQTDNCIDQELQGTYQLCWAYRDMSLVNINSEEYQIALENNIVERFSHTKVKEGQRVKILRHGSQQEVYYIGRFHKILLTERKRKNYSSPYLFDAAWDKKRYFFTHEPKAKNPYCFSLTSTQMLKKYDEVLEIDPLKFNLFKEKSQFNLSIDLFPNRKSPMGHQEYYGEWNVENIKGTEVQFSYKEQKDHWGLMCSVNGHKFRLKI